jgi:PD-(D/E)XK nuclease superfamily
MSDERPVPMRLAIPEWTPPWPASAPTYVRLTPTHLRPRGCAEQVARKARPDVFTDERSPWEPTGVGSFPLGLVRDALLLLLIEGPPAAGRTAHERVTAAIDRAIDESWEDWSPDSRAVVEAGVVGYLEVLESLRADGSLPETRVFPDIVAVQDPDGDRVELWAWAIHHVSLDGVLREAHLLRWRDAGRVPLQDAEADLVAHVAGSGVIAEHAKWYQRFEPKRGVTQPPSAQCVRVRIVGVLDSSTDVRFDGTPADAAEAASRRVPEHLGLLAGGTTSPSGGCAGCNVRHVCAGPLRMPGLLGVTGYSPRTRSISPSALWTHRACPRQLHLSRDLGLPRTPMGDSPALVRGTQVHAWLAAAHARGSACSTVDLPESADGDGVHTPLGWSAEEYATNRPYLLNHLGHCPLDDPSATGLSTEVAVTAWDTDANVILSTRPDTAWRRGDGRWVLRETKTLSPRGLPEDRTLLLDRYTQVAASICLLADGFTADGVPARVPGIVELELLGPDAGAVIEYDASDPVVVLVARTALADRIDAWLFDTTHPVGPNPPCRTCEVFEWCEISPVSAVEEVTADLLPATGTASHDWAVPDVVLRDLAAADVVEEFPF